MPSGSQAAPRRRRAPLRAAPASWRRRRGSWRAQPGAPATLTDVGGLAASAQALAFFRIPLFLLPIYRAAAIQYGVPWQILAAINEVETNYGSDLSVSSAGAEGWMQFEPS